MKMIDDAGLTDDPSDADKADRTLIVSFSTEKRLNHAANNRVAEMNKAIEEKAELLDHAHKFEDAKAERANKLSDDPIYRDIEFISIKIPGDNTLTVHRPIMPADRHRFRAKYEAFKKNAGQPIEGEPLISLPGMKDGVIKELAYVGVTTIDQLAVVADNSPLARLIMGFQQLKQSAAKWVATNRKSSLVNQTNEALAERDAQIAELRAAVAALQAANEKPVKAASK